MDNRVDDDFAGLEAFIPDVLPPGAVPLTAMLVLEYIDADGSTDYTYVAFGEMHLAHSVGLVEIAKDMVLRDAEEEDDETT